MARPIADGTLSLLPDHLIISTRLTFCLRQHIHTHSKTHTPLFSHQPNSLFSSFLPSHLIRCSPPSFTSPLPPPPMPPRNAPRRCARRAPAVPSCTFLFHRPACLPPRVPLDRLAGLILSRLICSHRQQPSPEVGPFLCLAEFSFEQLLQYIDAGGSASFGSTRVRTAVKNSVVSN